MNIAFLDFWDGFNIHNNFFLHTFKDIKENITITPPELSDIIIYSCFGQEHKKYNHCKKIFYTGENRRPDFNECNYSFSFDIDDYDNKNIRIPLWYLYIDWFNVKTYDNPNWLIPVNYLDRENPFNTIKKDKFCSTVFSAYYDIRFKIINTINSYNVVDCYGKIHNNKLLDGELEKMKTICNYKFNICFENSVYDGYFTEKLLHAKVSGAIPIYYSSKKMNIDFNPNCCINLIDYENFNDALVRIKEINENEEVYLKILKEPLFDKLPDIVNIKNKIYKIL